MSSLVLSQSSPSSRVSGQLSLLVPGLLVLAAYGGWWMLAEVPGAGDVAKLQTDVQMLSATCPTPEMIQQLRQRVAALRDEQVQVKQEFAEVRQRAERISRDGHKTVERMDLLILLTAVFERHNMIVSADRAVDDAARPQLARSLSDGLQDLAGALQRVSLSTGEPAAPYAPIVVPGLEQAISAEDLVGIVRGRSGGAGGPLPPLRMREVTVWGAYHDFVAALESIQKHCPDLFVIAIGMRPAEPGDPATGHGWTVLLSIHPSLNEVSIPAEIQPRQPARPPVLVADDRQQD